MNLKVTFLILTGLYSISSFAFCKLNQYGHNVCMGQKALYVIPDKEETEENRKNLRTVYKPVIVKKLHVHEPVAFISGSGIKNKKIHVDEIMGNKLWKDTEVRHSQKVRLKPECRIEGDKKSYKVSKVYEDRQLTEDTVELKTGFIFKKTRIVKQGCLDI